MKDNEARALKEIAIAAWEWYKGGNPAALEQQLIEACREHEEVLARLFGDIRIVCAWCGKGMGIKPGLGLIGTSHGICDLCAEAQFPQNRR